MILPTGAYRVIVADPPWHFSGGKKSRPQHYGRMRLPEIMALPVKQVAHPEGCRLFLWVTMPLLPRGFEVMHAWGFRYSTARVWGKLWPNADTMFLYPDSFARGTGYEVAGNAEVLLIGKRGKPQRAPASKPASIVFARRREHSRKPDCLMAEIARTFEGPRLEMFARTERPGWVVCGNETGKFESYDADADRLASYTLAVEAKREQGIREGRYQPTTDDERRQAAEGPKSLLDCLQVGEVRP